LSLDGGGVRGLSALLILREIMEQIRKTTNTERLPLPFQYFDLIGGTGTGGLIALMLGRLQMVTMTYQWFVLILVG
jgi:patatin-like phospholipase/acyl hydrolase